MPPKPFYQSKILWVNIVSMALVILAELAREQYGLSPSWIGLVALLTPILNVVLRFLTTQPVALTRQPKHGGTHGTG
jgi:hypothetical protein